MLNWLVIGVGDITTRRVIPAIREEPRSHLYGVVSRTPERASEFAEHVWDNLDDAMLDPTIDAVYVATPVALHAPQTIAALRAGKHVLCEKPVAMNYPEASTMVDEAHKSGRVLGVAYYRRTYPKVQRAKQLIEQGAIGQPVLAEASHHGELPALGSFRSWLIDPALAGGGPLFDVASHRIDLLNYFFGTPGRVTAQRSNAVLKLPVEDNATVLIEYESGVRGIVDVRWHSKVVRDGFKIIGTAGEIDLTPLSGPELTFSGGRELLPTHSNIHFPCIQNFVDAVLDGAPLISSGESAIWTDWITDRACHC